MALEPLDSQPLRCTADFIALHARRRPRHVAVTGNDHETTYAALHAELTAMIAAMAGLGLPRGALVALAHPDIRPRLLVALALERLGVTMVSFRDDAAGLDDPVLGQADLVMSATEIGAGRCKRFLRMTDEWLADALSRDAGAAVLADLSADDRVLMTRTSGSTGRPKVVVVTRAMLAVRLAERIANYEFRPDDRFLAVMNFSVATMYYASLAMLRIGATLISTHAVTLPEALHRYRPTKMNVLPYQLLALLREFPDLPRLPDLVLLLGGANVTPMLRRQALARLCGRVIEIYSSNETGPIRITDDDGHTRLNPWLDVDIAGADGASVSPGTVGEIRVRGPSVIAGYEGDPAATEAARRDGWWHTGDFGFLTSDGELRLLGTARRRVEFRRHQARRRRCRGGDRGARHQPRHRRAGRAERGGRRGPADLRRRGRGRRRRRDRRPDRRGPDRPVRGLPRRRHSAHAGGQGQTKAVASGDRRPRACPTPGTGQDAAPARAA